MLFNSYTACHGGVRVPARPVRLQTLAFYVIQTVPWSAIKYELPSRQPVEVTCKNQTYSRLDRSFLYPLHMHILRHQGSDGALPIGPQSEDKHFGNPAPTFNRALPVILKQRDPAFLPAFRLLIYPYLSPKIRSQSNKSIQPWLTLNISSNSSPA